ncbi:MAG: hypothetical protein AMXMBFR7_51610 [Planctomycetota bacterium]
MSEKEPFAWKKLTEADFGVMRERSDGRTFKFLFSDTLVVRCILDAIGSPAAEKWQKAATIG